jgi:hypothetical protein
VSHPNFNGGLKAALTTDLKAYVYDDGNWSSDSGYPTHRSIAFYLNGVLAFGFLPTWRDEDYSSAISRGGCFARADVYGWRSEPLLPGTRYEIQMKAGIRYVGWADSLGVDKMEWGSGNPSDNGATEVLATTGELIVPSVPPPPPPPPPVPSLSSAEARAQIDGIVRTWETGRGGPAPGSRLTEVGRIAGQDSTDARWLKGAAPAGQAVRAALDAAGYPKR